MDFLNQEITFDAGHLLLLLAIFAFIFYCVQYCNKKEGLNVQQVKPQICKCKDCASECFRRALNNEFYGCRKDDPLNPYSPQQCETEYRKCMLHGCGIA